MIGTLHFEGNHRLGGTVSKRMPGWRMNARIASFIIVSLCLGSSVFGQSALRRYALVLEDEPASARGGHGATAQSLDIRSYRLQLERKQQVLRDTLSTRKIHTTGAVSTVLNAVFVTASEDRLAELKALPGVKGVVRLGWRRLDMNQAAQLVNAPAAWSALGGFDSSGKGMRIAILDTGIDNTHPAFQDSSLAMPAGFPKCDALNASRCSEFTNNKVIVARSYVSMIAQGTDPNNPAADTRPDDLTPRDRRGHGTGTASCAAANTNTGVVTFSGIAPKAYLGNYKITGSSEVNESAPDDVIIQAADDAIADGMTVLSFSFGSPALTGPLDTGSTCGNTAGVACDLVAQTFENIVTSGLATIVAAAGNDGQTSTAYPNYNAMGTPADAPSVIGVGATTNSHAFVPLVRVTGSGVPTALQAITVSIGDALLPYGAIAAPLRDVTQVGNDGYACSALPAGSLVGTIALIENGPGATGCTPATKATNAQDAGALGVILYMENQSRLISPSGLASFNIPVVLISSSDAAALKAFVTANPSHPVTIDPDGIEQSVPGDQLAFFSSLGPAIGTAVLKPDVVAPGTNIYMAVQNYDPLGDLYSSTRYAAVDGTSFSTPIVAGAAALVKQQHPSFTPLQVKSAIVNTASQTVTTDDSGNPVSAQWLGAGKLDVGAAVNTTVTITPATLSFGILNSTPLPQAQQLHITNTGSGSVNLTLAVAAANASNGAAVKVDRASLSLGPGATGTVTVTLAGSTPAAGAFSGALTIQGAGSVLRVPYLYMVGDGTAVNLFPMSGDNNDGTVNGGIPDGILSVKLTDQYGVPVAGAPVTWTASGNADVSNSDSVTDANGIAAAQPVLGSQPGPYTITVTGPNGQKYTFHDTARAVPNIPANAIANAASFDVTQPVAPGSYITIGGTGLSDVTDYESTTVLPLAIDYVNVSFDVPPANISVAGHLTYVSANQVNLQVPWELQGQTSALVKVTIDQTYGNVVTLALSDYSPAFFEGTPGAVAALDMSYKVINATHPAARGQMVQLYANGLGPVTNQPASGDPAPASPLATTKATPVVMIGGQPAAVQFSGLAPGFAGLYQINVTVPAGLSAGNQTLTVSIGGKTSKTSGIAVQ